VQSLQSLRCLAGGSNEPRELRKYGKQAGFVSARADSYQHATSYMRTLLGLLFGEERRIKVKEADEYTW
jgi:hypothetical protein